MSKIIQRQQQELRGLMCKQACINGYEAERQKDMAMQKQAAEEDDKKKKDSGMFGGYGPALAALGLGGLGAAGYANRDSIMDMLGMGSGPSGIMQGSQGPGDSPKIDIQKALKDFGSSLYSGAGPDLGGDSPKIDFQKALKDFGSSLSMGPNMLPPGISPSLDLSGAASKMGLPAGTGPNMLPSGISPDINIMDGLRSMIQGK